MPGVNRIGFTELASTEGAGDHSPGSKRVKYGSSFIPNSLILTYDSIIFVHGLRGHPYRTWASSKKADNERAVGSSSWRQKFKSRFKSTPPPSESSSTQGSTSSRQQEIFWPEDYLAKDIREARVWTYGYNADVIGGLFKANNQSSVSDSNKKPIETLEVDNEVLDNIHEQFVEAVVEHGIRIHSFQEGRGLSGMKGLNEKVVSDFSSKLGLPKIETIESIDANHMQMARCNDRSSESYRCIAGVLKLLLKTANRDTDLPLWPVTQVDAPCSTTASYCIPFRRNRRFIGRTKKLKELEEKLIISSHCQELALVGLGGVGKTQVALQFAYTVKEHWPEYSIFWAPAIGAESFEQAYRDIATRCSIALDPKEEDPKESVRRYLESDVAGKWLLIIDNADDEEILFGESSDSGGLTDYLPQSEYGLTLFTTRHREIAVSLARNEVVEVHEMDQEEAETFLKESLTQKEMVHDQDDTTELLDELAFLPLAIAQAAAYINAMQIPIPEYLSLLRSTEQDTVSLLSREFRDDTRYKNSRNAVAATWLISFDRIRRSEPDAADLLSFMSCLQHKAIPRTMLPSVEPAERTVHAMGILHAYAFVTQRDDGNSYDMHRLVHLATKVWVDKHGATEALNEKVAAHLAEIFPSEDYANQAIWREYFPHALQFLRHTQTLDIEARYDLCKHVGNCLRVDGRVGEAVVWLSECFLWRQGRYPEDDPERLASQHELARAYLVDGRVKEAVGLLEQVVVIWEKLLDEDNPDRLAAQHLLAGAYLVDGQVEAAVKLLEQVVAKKEVLREDHPERLVSQHALAMAYKANGHVEKAIKLLEHVVAIEKKVLTEDHPTRLASQHELAMAYRANGQVKQTLKLLEHVVVKKKVLNEKHPSRLASQHELGNAYEADGQVEAAVELLEHVVAKHKVLKEDHPNRLSSQHELARAYLADGQIKEAVKLLEHVVAIEKKVLREDHPYRLSSQDTLVRAYKANGQVKEAKKVLEHIVAVKEKVLGEDHPDRLASQERLAVVYWKDGLAKEAIKLLEQVIAIQKKALREDHPDRLRSERMLLEMQAEQRSERKDQMETSPHSSDEWETASSDGEEGSQSSRAKDDGQGNRE
ncbi:MAG: hypothetical protein Q9208_004221 [Pyrenodesmia sp. 3 TL-2023]